jgi:hypothetical protein
MGTGASKSQRHEVATSKSANRDQARVSRARSSTIPRVGNRAMGELLFRTKQKSDSPNHLNHRGESPKQTGRSNLPNALKAGIENLSGMSMNDVRVHYNSSRPAKLGALAHTQGSNIYVGPGQEKHLGHEAWHVVQQKQGRVNTSHSLNRGTSINANPELEAEADRMGETAVRSGSSTPTQSYKQQRTIAANVAQCKKIPDAVGANDYGQFETTTFAPLNDSGVTIVLKFHPNKVKADAKKIGMSQSVKANKEDGTPYAVNPTMANRMVASGSAAGFTIDASGATNNPLYFDTKNLGASQDLKDTPGSNATGNVRPQLGSNTHYELGSCYKVNARDAERTAQSAAIIDKPEGIKRKGAGMTFETAALALEGADKGKYYGSVKWGYKVGGTTAAPKVEAADISDISEASKGTPTANFIEAASLWNTGKTRGTLEVNPPDATVPDAWVQRVQGTPPARVPRGTKLTMRRAVKGSTEGMIEAMILNADGTDSGNVVNIYVADVKDKGDGAANKPLPIPGS